MLQFILSLLSMLCLLSSTELAAQSASLIEDAKKEGGRVLAYGSLESEAFDAVKADCQKKTGLEKEYGDKRKEFQKLFTQYRS